MVVCMFVFILIVQLNESGFTVDLFIYECMNFILTFKFQIDIVYEQCKFIVYYVDFFFYESVTESDNVQNYLPVLTF